MVTEPLQGITSIGLRGGWLALDFANTVHNFSARRLRDEVVDYAALVTWSERTGVVSPDEARRLREAAQKHPRKAAGVLADARDLRKDIYEAFVAIAKGRPPRAAVLRRLEREWAKTLAHASLVAGPDGVEWSWGTGAAVAMDRMLWPITGSAIELLTSPDSARVRQCNAHDCTWLFLDKTKNKSRRWCDMESCGNREKARRHYSKTRNPHAH